MANGRAGSRKQSKHQIDGPFTPLLWRVLDSHAYADLSYPARALLLEIARQYVRDNNGRLLCSMNHLRRRGWRSADVVTRAKRDLLDHGFIFETVKGRLPNRAAWYALTWRPLDRHPDFDPGATGGFVRDAYLSWMPNQNSASVPVPGTRSRSIEPSPGTSARSPVPSGGAVRPLLGKLPIPAAGNHLEKPSVLTGQHAAMEQLR